MRKPSSTKSSAKKPQPKKPALRVLSVRALEMITAAGEQERRVKDPN